MATFLLCHGGFAGGWQWRQVAELLRANGHTVYTPTFTGLGERVHLAHPDVDLDTLITDVVNVIQYEELTDVTLVGYSFSGMVITGVADLIPERLSRLVYLDAYVPRDGESLVDLLGTALTTQLMAMAEGVGDGWKVPHIPNPDEDPDPRYTFQPLKTGLQPVRSNNPSALSLPRTFIFCTEGKDLLLLGQPIVDAARTAQTHDGWHYYELATGHVPMETLPDALAELLSQIATQPETA